MTQNIRDAVVAIEDDASTATTAWNRGSILRAAVNDLRSGHVIEGGSTITQQLVKNLYTGNQQSFGRKIDEALLAGSSRTGSRSRTCLEYLNTVYFGEGAYGIQRQPRRTSASMRAL